MPHSDRKLIKQALNCTLVTNLKTFEGNTFFAIAAESSKVGKFIQLAHNNRIYPCCWGNQTNHMGKDGQR